MNDIEKILSEDPIIENNKPISKKFNKFKRFRNFKKPDLKNLFTKDRLIIGVVVILVLLGLFLITSHNECDECKVCEIYNDTQGNLFNDIRNQIINKGYAEISEGSDKLNNLKLAPYLE